MTVAVRKLRPDEGRMFLEVHHAAVRGLAATDYPSAVIEAWAPLPITDRHLERFLANPDGEIRLAAEIDGEVIGIGALVPENAELRACYVAPTAARRGVGSALVRSIEDVAREHRLSFLHLDSSLTAEPFYVWLGYRTVERATHLLGSGQPMACIKMRKDW